MKAKKLGGERSTKTDELHDNVFKKMRDYITATSRRRVSQLTKFVAHIERIPVQYVDDDSIPVTWVNMRIISGLGLKTY